MKDCNLVLLKQQLFQTMSSFVLPRHSPILPAVNYYMSLMDESGILEKLRQRWWRGQPCEDIGTVTAYQSLGLWEVCSAGLLMLVGVVMAVLVCCLEHAGPRLHHTSLITRTTTSNRNRSISSECIPSSQRCSTNTTHGQVLKTVLSD
ncbi:uncharacterized protein LOC121874659 [Homarus americanus]|nr:uncharacterized protein LOC121874659 [Homarus americanus]